MIINMVGGGGGAALNFKVVPGLTQPGTASENTIWVKTERIGAWYFSATQPEGMQEWDVWFPTGTESDVKFNALKKNEIQIYPLYAKQYYNGALVDVPAMSYKGGKWVKWTPFGALYWRGDQRSTVTGGWTISANGTSTATKPVATYNEDSVRLVATGSTHSGNWTTSKVIDLTSAKTLKVALSEAKTISNLLLRAGPKSDGITGKNPAVNVSVSEAGVTSVDVSALTGEYYVRLYSYGILDVTVTEVYWE